MTKKNQKKVTIGLFGTCGKSKWRDTFIHKFEEMGMKEKEDYFNPQVDDWKPEMAQEEAWHLANDSILCVPITGETYGIGSLAETGFSLLNAIRLDDRRDFIVMVEQILDGDLFDNDVQAHESLRARSLVLQHLLKLNLSNVYLVDTLDEMLEVALACRQSQLCMEPFRSAYNPSNKAE